jgi:hypothetical protein
MDDVQRYPAILSRFLANRTYCLRESKINEFCIAALECMRSVSRTVRSLSPIQYVFDQNEKGFGVLQKLAIEDSLPKPIQRSNRDAGSLHGVNRDEHFPCEPIGHLLGEQRSYHWRENITTKLSVGSNSAAPPRDARFTEAVMPFQNLKSA